MRLPEGFDYRPVWIRPATASALFQRLWHEAEWRQRDIVLFGRKLQQPRLTAWCSDPGIHYRYSGLDLAPRPWHPALPRIRDELSALLGAGFNSVLLNAYRDGRDSMGWHADDEPELGAHPVIASVSLGATRRMLLRPAGGGRLVGVDLENGSLLVMSGTSQEDWRHSVPKVKTAVGPRINLTFREIL